MNGRQTRLIGIVLPVAAAAASQQCQTQNHDCCENVAYHVFLSKKGFCVMAGGIRHFVSA
jgi:hypothetical protein